MIDGGLVADIEISLVAISLDHPFGGQSGPVKLRNTSSTKMKHRRSATIASSGSAGS